MEIENSSGVLKIPKPETVEALVEKKPNKLYQRFIHLTDQTFIRVLTFLDIISLFNLQLTNKYFRCKFLTKIWFMLCKLQFGYSHQDSIVNDDELYYRAYRMLHFFHNPQEIAQMYDLGAHSKLNNLIRMFIKNSTSFPEMYKTLELIVKNLELNDSTFSSNYHQSVSVFDDLALNPELLKRIYAKGFETPSKVQKQAIIPMLQGRDVIVRAQAGSGKTIAYVISLLQLINTASLDYQVLVLAPTREVVGCINNTVSQLGENLKVITNSVVGGVKIAETLSKLKEGGQVIVGTPGRVSDLLNKGALKMEHMKLLILDEADELWGRGFQEQVEAIFKSAPREARIAVFTSTMPIELLNMTNQFMIFPARIDYRAPELTLEGIKQFYVALEKEEWKLETLFEIYNEFGIHQSLIFCNNSRKSDLLAKKMREKGFSVSVLNGNSDASVRELNITNFRTGASKVMICTDSVVNSSGLGASCNIKINYDLPTHRENYLWRLGRSGKFGRKGVAISFVMSGEENFLRDLENYYQTEISELPMNFAELL